MAVDIGIVRDCFAAGLVLYSGHAKREMETEEFGRIVDREVGEAIAEGDVIQQYPDDRPYPSVLVFGRTAVGRPIHTVCAVDSATPQVIVVTVYEPDPSRWIEFRQRRTE